MAKKKTHTVKRMARAPRSAVTGQTPPAKLMREGLELLEEFDTRSKSAFDKSQSYVKNILVSEEIEDECLYLMGCALSTFSLPGYSTLDYNHVKEINSVIAKIERYSADKSQKRPLNVLMLASPGAGKSHLIQCMAERLGKRFVGAVTFNMAALERGEDLFQPLDAVRNVKVEDRLPLLFLDEFDSDYEKLPLLLPLLWDGRLTLGPRDLKLGRVIIVLAGSDSRLPHVIQAVKSMRADSRGAVPGSIDQPKLVDLLSRINGGVFDIPELSEGHQADKICIANGLLRFRFNDQIRSVPLSLIRLVAEVRFRYGVRSIAHVIDQLPPAKQGVRTLERQDLELPLQSSTALREASLVYHLFDEKNGDGLVEKWGGWEKSDRPVLLLTKSLESALRQEFFTPNPENPKSYRQWILERFWRTYRAEKANAARK